MKVILAILVATGFQLSAFAAPKKPVVSNFIKGILCKKIEATYGKFMLEGAYDHVMDKYLICREHGSFAKHPSKDNVYAVNTPSKTGYLSCVGEIASGKAKTPGVKNLNCVEVVK